MWITLFNIRYAKESRKHSFLKTLERWSVTLNCTFNTYSVQKGLVYTALHLLNYWKIDNPALHIQISYKILQFTADF